MTSRHIPVSRGTAAPRIKRVSLHLDCQSKKRRKIDQIPDSRSSVVQPASNLKQQVTCTNPFVTPGLVLVCGVGDTGQLGLGPDVTQRSRPSRFGNASLAALGVDELGLETLVVQVCAGGMHTVCLTSTGRVVTFGCNDEGALGRSTVDPASISESLPLPKRPHLEALASSPDRTGEPYADETRPAFVPLPLSVKICMVSAGDSHTAALDSNGQVWIWGTFRGPNGPIGLTQPGEISMTPKQLLAPPSSSNQSDLRSNLSSSSNSSHLMPGTRIIKIASGQDHLACLTEEGRLYTMGCGEQGQLGRIAERFARTGGRSGLGSLLYPTECRVRGSVRFSDVWAGGFATFARCQASGSIYACGLNNYGQLGLKKPSILRSASTNSNTHNGEFKDEEDVVENHEDSTDDVDVSIDAVRVLTDQREADRSEAALIARQGPLIQFMLTRARGFNPTRDWKQFAVSVHHTLALDAAGCVYSIGRSDYGRLGLGKSVSSSGAPVSQPTRVQGVLSNRNCLWVGCGEACSFAVDIEGVAYSWGIGSNQQLGSGDGEDDEDSYEPRIIKGKQMQQRYVSMVDAGGQHTVLLVHSTPPVLTNPQMNDIAVTVENPDNATLSTSLDVAKSTTDTDVMDVDSYPTTEVPMDAKKVNGLHVNNDTCVVEKSSDEADTLPPDSSAEPILIPPDVPQARRVRHLSPCSLTLPPPPPTIDSTTGSTAGATVNSSVHSSAISDTSSIGSCASNTSTSSQLNSAKSTDGGGTSRCGSFDTYSG